jgi:BMFP domain-containing protein YqiC
MHTKNPIFDEAAKFVTGAMGAAQAAGDEAQALIRAQADRLVADMDLVSREEADATKALAQAALQRVEELETRLKVLEERLNSEG